MLDEETNEEFKVPGEDELGEIFVCFILDSRTDFGEA